MCSTTAEWRGRCIAQPLHEPIRPRGESPTIWPSTARTSSTWAGRSRRCVPHVDEEPVDHACASSLMRACSAPRTGSSFVDLGRERANVVPGPRRRLASGDELRAAPSWRLSTTAAPPSNITASRSSVTSERHWHEGRARGSPGAWPLRRRNPGGGVAEASGGGSAQAGYDNDATSRRPQSRCPVRSRRRSSRPCPPARHEPVAEHRRHAEQEVARAPVAVAARPVQVAHDAPADRRITRWVERKHLAVLREPA